MLEDSKSAATTNQLSEGFSSRIFSPAKASSILLFAARAFFLVGRRENAVTASEELWVPSCTWACADAAALGAKVELTSVVTMISGLLRGAAA